MTRLAYQVWVSDIYAFQLWRALDPSRELQRSMYEAMDDWPYAAADALDGEKFPELAVNSFPDIGDIP